MKIYLDGYNVIGQTHHIQLSDSGKERVFIEWIQKYVVKGVHLVIIFDGQNEFLGFPIKERLSGITVVSTSGTRSADDYIKQEILLKKKSDNSLIVTSDRDILDHAKKSKFNVMTSDAFLRWFCRFHDANGGAKPSPKDISERHIDYWLNEFGS